MMRCAMIVALVALMVAAACRDSTLVGPEGGANPAPVPMTSSSVADTLLATTDFSDYPLDLQPAGWTKRWSTNGSWTVQADTSGTFAGNAKLVLNSTNASGRKAFSWDPLGTPSDVRLHTRVRMSTINGGWMAGLIIAGGGTSPSTINGYSWRFRNYNGFYGVELTRYVNGQYKFLGQHPFAFQANTFYHLVLEKEGTSLRAKVWTEGEAEPAWQIEAVDTMHQSGWAGLDNYDRGIMEFDFLEAHDPSVQLAVPPQAPDTLPAWVMSGDSTIAFFGVPEYRVVRNVISVEFKAGTSQADRQAAIGAIDGEVIGGRPAPPNVAEGTYYVRIQGDDTGRAAVDAADYLNSLPQVGIASFVLLAPREWFRAWRLPNDDLAFSRSQWRVQFDPASSLTPTWSREIIDAPLAWGCETGSADVQIAIVDDGFQRIPDLDGNIQKLAGLPPVPEMDPDNPYHGTQVAAILGAEGDNQLGITGMMWTAGLRLYDWTFDPETNLPRVPSLISDEEGLQSVASRIRQAGNEGARVINLSGSAPWPMGYQPFSDPDRQQVDSLIAASAAEYLRYALRAVRDETNNRPLLVLAAGNHAVAAELSGFPEVATEPEFADQVLVVGGLDVLGGFPTWWNTFDPDFGAAGANYGSAVQIAAPAVVHTLFRDGAHVTAAGTSLAAPLVAGTAGLLASFDPNLSNEQLKEYLLEGARRGERVVTDPAGNSVPILNAYESLKAAAERPGAPLCGNRVWVADGGTITVRRTAGQVDVIATVGDSVWGITPMHGGKRVDYSTGAGTRTLLWDSTSHTWRPVSAGTRPDSIPSGAARSVRAISHDGDSIASVNPPYRVDEYQAVDVPVRISFQGGVPVTVGTVRVVGQSATPAGGGPSQVCRARDVSGNCTEGYYWSKNPSNQNYRVALAPRGGHVYVAVNHFRTTVSHDTASWRPCSVAAECRPLAWETQSSGATIHVVAPNGTTTQVASLPNTVFWLGLGADDNTLVLGVGTLRRLTWDDRELGRWTDDSITGCRIEYRSENFIMLFEQVQTREACYIAKPNGTGSPGDPNGGGTIAAQVIGSHGTTGLEPPAAVPDANIRTIRLPVIQDGERLREPRMPK